MANVRLEPIVYGALPGWADDDHLAAYKAFLRSAPRLVALADEGHAPPALVAACRRALAAPVTDRAAARAFFETAFTPHQVIHDGAPGLLTGYYEPILKGARTRSEAFPVPVYARPGDLVNMVAEHERGSKADRLTHMRRTAAGLEPYFTRAEIEAGALADKGLELCWLADPVDFFFMQVQGSGRIELDDGTTLALAYDGKNGHHYTSVGRVVIDEGGIPEADMTLQALHDWLRTEPARGKRVMQRNESFVFFRVIGSDEEGPLGGLGIPLTPHRSLAVDVGYHALGTPVFLTAPTVHHAEGAPGGLARLMIAQDVGSAIRGPERGDYYFGAGAAAGAAAGITKHPCRFTVLVAREGAGSP
jgi:membrane-bound lytic murein transglycosylase A